MDVIAQKGLIFVDSMTTAGSVGDAVCHKKGVSILKRDIFLDSTDDVNVVKKQLMQTAEVAKEKGYASGSVMTVICKLLTSIKVSCLHFGQ